MMQNSTGGWVFVNANNPLPVNIQTQSNDLQATELERLLKANDQRIRVVTRNANSEPTLLSYTSTALNLTYRETRYYTPEGEWNGADWNKQ